MKKTWLLVALLATLPCAVQAQNRIDAASLDRYYQLMYGAKIEQLSSGDLAKDFMSKMQDDDKMMACDGMREMFADFAKEEFTPNMRDFMRSDAVSGPIKQALREHLTQADVDAFLAFVDTPAGRSYMQHSGLAEAAADEKLDNVTKTMFESPQMKQMMTGLVSRMMPVVMQCQSDD